MQICFLKTFHSCGQENVSSQRRRKIEVMSKSERSYESLSDLVTKGEKFKSIPVQSRGVCESAFKLG